MADNPMHALQVLNESDERQRSPVSRFAKSFLRVVKLFAPKGAELGITALEAANEWLGEHAEANRNEFVDVIAEEINYRGQQIEDLMAKHEDHRRFVQEE